MAVIVPLSGKIKVHISNSIKEYFLFSFALILREMPKKFRAIIAIILFVPLTALTQKDTLITKLDSLTRKTDSAGKQVNNTNPEAYNQATKITFKNYFVLLASDLKQEFTKPFHMTKRDWGNLGKFSLVLVGVGFADETIQKNSVTFMRDKPALQNISKYVTRFGGVYERYTLATFAAYGIIFKKPKMVNTTLLATQAYITGMTVEGVFKFLTPRTRPSYYSTNIEAEPKFLRPFKRVGKDANGRRSYSSFPSGHTTVAFAAATVFAKEYKDKIYVPILAYSAATLIGVSRITENRHWATDVLAGAAIGYLTGRNVVNNYHRYAKLKAPQKNGNSISLNFQYVNGQLHPGLIYKFR
jgi:membrane-associated phospholipid phosphatase